jgi:hypothetical protein
MNFTNKKSVFKTNREQVISDNKQNKPYKNPFAKNDERKSSRDLPDKEPHTNIFKQTEEKKLNVNDTEEFPGLPSLKKPSTTLQTTSNNSWSAVTKVMSEQNVVFTLNPSSTKHRYGKYIQEQEKIRRQLQELTREQLRREQLNEELGEESPFWGAKNLIHSESDTDDSSYESD